MNSNMEKPYVVGIDIGGTNSVFGIVDARGTIIASGSVKTQAYSTVEEYVDEVCKNLLPLIISQGGVEKIKGIGIGAPNGNYYSGTIEFAPNLPWKGIIPLAAMFEERLGIPTALTNDANAAAVGEMTYGAARTDASLLRNISAENITSKDVYDAAVQGDKLAQEIFEFTGTLLGEALADFIAFSSPEAIVLFGGLAKSGDYIMKPIHKAMEDNLLNIYKGKTKLLVSELKDSDAAVLGASALAWELKDM